MKAAGDQVFIGWDVGGWNCHKNPNSHDALVVLDGAGARIGQPWRGNLRQTLNSATAAADFSAALLALCKLPTKPMLATIAIYPPRLSRRLRRLTTGAAPLDQIGQSAANPYLYRATARRVVAEGVTPCRPSRT